MDISNKQTILIIGHCVSQNEPLMAHLLKDIAGGSLIEIIDLNETDADRGMELIKSKLEKAQQELLDNTFKYKAPELLAVSPIHHGKVVAPDKKNYITGRKLPRKNKKR